MTILVEACGEKFLKIKSYIMWKHFKWMKFVGFIERRVARQTVEPVTFTTKCCAAGCNNIIL
jgi:hypothetical protein